MYSIQEIMQVEGEKRSPPEHVYADGKSRPKGFPARPKANKIKHGGGIGKKMKLLKPFFVKLKGRNLCLCWRHLEWDFLTDVLHQWRKANKESHRGQPPAVSEACHCSNVRDAHTVRKNLMCDRRERTPEESTELPVLGVDFDLKGCIDRTCDACAGLSRLEMCEEERAVQRGVKYMKRVKVEYTTIDGTEKSKYDFVMTTEPIADFLAHVEVRLADLAPHHADMVWQRKDWVHVQNHFPRGSWIYVYDYSENLTIEVKNEHQSKYYSQVPVTLHGVVATFWIDDVKETHLPLDVANRLKAELSQEGKPAQVNVAHCYVSDDTRHNQAFVQFPTLPQAHPGPCLRHRAEEKT
jgi:hypothetical protein